MADHLEVIFTNQNEDDAKYKVLRLFFGKYGNGGALKFKTQTEIADAIQSATGNDYPAQSTVSKVLAKLENETLVYNGKSYRIGWLIDCYKLIDEKDYVEVAKAELSKNRKYLGEKVFRNNVHAIPTVYGFRVSKNNVKVKSVVDNLKMALGDSYFGVIEHEDILFLFLNPGSESFSQDSKWLESFCKTTGE